MKIIKQLFCTHKYWPEYKIDLYIYKGYADWMFQDIRGSRWRIYTCEKCWYKKIFKN